MASTSSNGRIRAPRLEARGVTKRFGRKTVLDGLDLLVAPGQVTALLGENGAGKSTLFSLFLGVMRAEAGAVRVLGLNPLTEARLVREQIGFVPAQPDVYGWMTVQDLFRFLAPQYPTWDGAYAGELVATLRIPERTRFRSLSRGEGMKALLAAALAPRPPVLLLDEPFAGLDPLVREEVLRSVIGELKAGERTVLVATHDLDVVARVADRVAVLAQGRIQTYAPLDELTAGPAAPGGAPQQLCDLITAARGGRAGRAGMELAPCAS